MYFYGQDMIEAGQLNAHLLVYMYKFVNYDQAAFPENKYNPYTNGYNANARVRVDSAWFNADGLPASRRRRSAAGPAGRSY